MKTMKKLRFAATLALAFAALTATAAKKMEVKVTATSEGGRYGYWVEYEVNGVKCRSDQVSMRMNKSAWARMSPEDRKKAVENVGYYDTRVSQFGVACAREMGTWYDTYRTHHADGAEILTDRHVKAKYPKYFEIFTEGTNMYGVISVDTSAYFEKHYKPQLIDSGSDIAYVAHHYGDTAEVSDMRREQRVLFEWAISAYETLRRATYIRLGAGLKSTSGDLIELICDRCLVPNITPAGSGGMAASIIGTTLDYINNIAGIQSRIIKDVVGERASSSAAMKVITHCDGVLEETDEFIGNCLARIEDLKSKIEAKDRAIRAAQKAQYEAESKYESEKVAEIERLWSVTSATETIVAKLKSLNASVATTLAAYNSAYEDYVRDVDEHNGWATDEIREKKDEALKAYENAKKNLKDYWWNTFENVKTRYNEWKEKYNAEISAIYARRRAIVWSEPTDANAKALIDGTGPEFTISDDDVAAMKAAVEKCLDARVAACRSQMSISADAVELACTGMEAANPILNDARALECLSVIYDGRSKSMFGESAYVDGGGMSTVLNGLKQLVAMYGSSSGYVSPKVDPESMARAARYRLDAFIEHRQAYLDEQAGRSEIAREITDEITSSYERYDSSFKAVDAFAGSLPKYVTDQTVDGYMPVLGEEGCLHVDAGTEIGRAFVADRADGTASTASEYRSNLSSLWDRYATLSSKNDACAQEYRAFRSLLNAYSVDSLRTALPPKEREKIADTDIALPYTKRSLGGGKALNVHKLHLLRDDFNNRNYAHTSLFEIFADLSNNYEKYSVKDAETATYNKLVASAREHASNRQRGSYAAHVPDYYVKVFASEPDPYNDMIAPLVSEISTARSGSVPGVPDLTTYTVTFDPNGGDGSMEPQIFTNGIPQALRPATFKKPFMAERFHFWWVKDSQVPVSYTNCEVITVSRDMTLYAKWWIDYIDGPGGGGSGGGGSGGGGSGGGSGGGTVEPTPTDAPTLFGPVTAELPFTGDATYNGWVRNADGSLAGLLTVKAAKAAKPEKGGQSKLTVTYTPFGGKKQTIKLPNDAMPVAGEVATVAIPGVGTVKFTGDALVGADVDVQAGKDMLKSKDKGEKAAATAAAASKAGVWTFALGTSAGYAAFTVTVDKKGKGKLAGTLPDGTKVSVSAQGVLGDGVLAIPFAYAKKSSLGLVFWVKGDGTATLSDLTGVGAASVVAPSASYRLADGEHTFTAGGVSQGFTVAGKKWNVPKQNKRAEVDPNPTGLKLAFTEKTGAVKGSFTVVDGKAKTKYTVVGVVVGGRFYGSAYVRNAVPIPATAE